MLRTRFAPPPATCKNHNYSSHPYENNSSSSSSGSSSSSSLPIRMEMGENIWSEPFKAHLDTHLKILEAQLGRLQIRTRRAICSDPLKDINRNQGDIRASNVLHCLNSLGYVRSREQHQFHQSFFQSCLPKIYGKEWEGSSRRVMESYSIEKIRYEVLAMTPRRFGKTVAVAMFVTAMLFNVPGITIAVFSTGKRASGSLTELVKKMLCNIPGGAQRVVKQNTEDLYVASVAPGDGKGVNSSEARSLQAAETTSKLKRYATKNKKKRTRQKKEKKCNANANAMFCACFCL